MQRRKAAVRTRERVQQPCAVVRLRGAHGPVCLRLTAEVQGSVRRRLGWYVSWRLAGMGAQSTLASRSQPTRCSFRRYAPPFRV
jgi:hypothetical protein